MKPTIRHRQCPDALDTPPHTLSKAAPPTLNLRLTKTIKTHSKNLPGGGGGVFPTEEDSDLYPSQGLSETADVSDTVDWVLRWTSSAGAGEEGLEAVHIMLTCFSFTSV